jgi:acetamidase/formamidase
MKRGSIVFAAAGMIIGGAWLVGASAIRAQQPAQQPAPAPTLAVPPIGPPDPNLRTVSLPSGKKVHLLPATLETTQWGWFDNAQPPVLRVNSGDTVVMETMMHSHNQVIPGTTIDQIKKLRTDYPGRGPHTVTGPIYIEGAEPGDVLKVTINKIVPRAYAANFNVPGMFGEFPNIYQDGQVKYFYLDWDRKIVEFLPGIEIPLKPFPGTLGVARKEPGRYSTVPPGEYAGNLDIRDFSEGTTLYVPVHVRGALLWSGDSHAAQGNGEVNLTAVETAYKELNLTLEVVKGKPLDFPRIETKTSWITMGFDQDLNKAWDQAKAQTVKFLSEQRNVSADQAARLMPTVSDCRISQVVNIKKGIHCLSPKDRSGREDTERPIKETAKYYVSHAKDADLNKAMDTASMGMMKWLETEKKIARLDAYGLASVAMDCRVGAISEGEKNVHCLLSKSIFVAKR